MAMISGLDAHAGRRQIARSIDQKNVIIAPPNYPLFNKLLGKYGRTDSSGERADLRGTGFGSRPASVRWGFHEQLGHARRVRSRGRML